MFLGIQFGVRGLCLNLQTYMYVYKFEPRYVFHGLHFVVKNLEIGVYTYIEVYKFEPQYVFLGIYYYNIRYLRFCV